MAQACSGRSSFRCLEGCEDHWTSGEDAALMDWILSACGRARCCLIAFARPLLHQPYLLLCSHNGKQGMWWCWGRDPCTLDTRIKPIFEISSANLEWVKFIEELMGPWFDFVLFLLSPHPMNEIWLVREGNPLFWSFPDCQLHVLFTPLEFILEFYFARKFCNVSLILNWMVAKCCCVWKQNTKIQSFRPQRPCSFPRPILSTYFWHHGWIIWPSGTKNHPSWALAATSRSSKPDNFPSCTFAYSAILWPFVFSTWPGHHSMLYL
jgi:hypothetical protein